MTYSKKQQAEQDEQLYQMSTIAAGTHSLQVVLDKLSEAAVKITGVHACAIRILDEQGNDLEMAAGYGLSDKYSNRGVVSRHDTVIKAAFAGEAIVIDDMRIDKRVKHPQAAIEEALISQLTVGIHFRKKPMGVLRLYRSELKPFTRKDISLARAVASQCAIAIINAKLYAETLEGQRIAEQMRLAGIIQRRMIPHKAPLIAGLDIAATYVPCFDVGGDFYDFIDLGSDSISVAVADVIGKGLPAAIMMSSFRGTLRAYADGGHLRHPLPEIIEKLNLTACRECVGGEFITLFYGVVDTGRMTLSYCNCGHEPGILFRDGQVIELDKGGLVLGIMPDARYEIAEMPLKDGDCLMFFTDGLTDAANFDGELWGRERMLEVVLKSLAGSSMQTMNNILNYRRRFVGLAPQSDDTSIIVMKVDRRAEPAFLKKEIQ
jgi:sigma-B regulation protein RsbU (phosphoserine phosphatase)